MLMQKYSKLSEEEYLEIVTGLIAKGYLQWKNGKVEPKCLQLKPMGFIKATEIMDAMNVDDALLVSIKCSVEGNMDFSLYNKKKEGKSEK